MYYLCDLSCGTRTRLYLVRFEVFTAVVMKSIIFWDVTPCSLLGFNRRGRWHLLACWFFLKLFLRPWRWRQYVSPKRRLKLNRLHGRRWYSSRWYFWSRVLRDIYNWKNWQYNWEPRGRVSVQWHKGTLKFSGSSSDACDLYWEVSGSNLRRNTGYHVISFCSFPHSLYANAGIVP
jgi:hypothetical protein